MRKTIEETGLQIKFKSANFARGSTLDRNHCKKHRKSRFISILLVSTLPVLAKHMALLANFPREI
jgi:hypothetical protein